MSIDRNSFFRAHGVPIPRDCSCMSLEPQHGFNGPVRKLFSLCAQLFRALIRKYRLRRDIQHVNKLDKRLLKDIGLEPDRFVDALRYGRDFNWKG